MSFVADVFLCVVLVFTETGRSDEVFGVQDRGACRLHQRAHGQGEVHVQADVPRRGRAPVPRTD